MRWSRCCQTQNPRQPATALSQSYKLKALLSAACETCSLHTISPAEARRLLDLSPSPHLGPHTTSLSSWPSMSRRSLQLCHICPVTVSNTVEGTEDTMGHKRPDPVPQGHGFPREMRSK